MDGYTPQTIVDQPIPLLSGEMSDATGSNSNPTSNSNAETPGHIRNTPIPVPVIAVDTIATSLNTQTRAIMGEFVFEQLGAIRIGGYVNGVSGEIDISPNGISGINVNGETTFAIDGTTGDATFKGEITAGSIVTGGEIRNANGDVIIDANGLVSQNSFRNGSVLDAAVINTASDVYVDGGTGLTFTLTQATKVLVNYSALMSNLQSGSNGVQTVMSLQVDSSDEQGPLVAGQGVPYFGGVSFISGAAATILSLAAGPHTIKIRYKMSTSTGGADAYIYQRQLSYLILGT